jgi:hypothetical protein
MTSSSQKSFHPARGSVTVRVRSKNQFQNINITLPLRIANFEIGHSDASFLITKVDGVALT